MGEGPKEAGRIPVAEVMCAADMVGYQAGAVVSRIILKRDTGSMTLFAFDQGQGLSEHTAPFDALAHVLEGEAEVAISGKPPKVKAGEMVVMPANQPHALTAVAKFKQAPLTNSGNMPCTLSAVVSKPSRH